MPPPPKQNPDSKPDPEETHSKNIDMCLTDAIIKGGGGILLGTLASVLIFKKRWPIMTGFGVGLGFSLANCQNGLNSEMKST